ncbi:unnamed protein product [Arabidopsis thaliana]|uniref:F-box domain-containing protein n=1 Tax=Arabidopsis thaliana TaxID=3702 RepID=A0A654FA02_ARATH|nr:unnamed protein product [Arabidopsis thaliana]
MSNLPRDLSDLPRNMAEEVLSRVPVTSLRRLRFTCKKWNTLSRCRSFAKKHLVRQAKVAAKKREYKVVMMMDFRVYLMRINLQNNVELCIKRERELLFPDASDQIYVRHVFHCDGLLLCIMKDNPRLVVCNPYSGQTRWIETTNNPQRLDAYSYALGYNSSTKSHKILSFVMMFDYVSSTSAEFKIYDFNSDSWRGDIWAAVCLRRPLSGIFKSSLLLSNVRDEQLAVLFQRMDTLQMEIWVTTKIEPNTVSWSSKFFLSVDMRELTGRYSMFSFSDASFFIDEEKKVAVVIDKGKKK